MSKAISYYDWELGFKKKVHSVPDPDKKDDGMPTACLTITYQSTTDRRMGGLISTLKGSVVFTAEPQRTLREMFF